MLARQNAVVNYQPNMDNVAMSQGQLSAPIRLTQQPLVYIVQMLPTSFLPQTTICNHSVSSAFCDNRHLGVDTLP